MEAREAWSLAAQGGFDGRANRLVVGATARWGNHCIFVFDMRTYVRMSSGIFSPSRIASVKVKCHRIGQMRTETHSAYLILVREVEIYSWPKAPTAATIPAR